MGGGGGGGERVIFCVCVCESACLCVQVWICQSLCVQACEPGPYTRSGHPKESPPPSPSVCANACTRVRTPSHTLDNHPSTCATDKGQGKTGSGLSAAGTSNRHCEHRRATSSQTSGHKRQATSEGITIPRSPIAYTAAPSPNPPPSSAVAPAPPRTSDSSSRTSETCAR